MSVSRRLTSGIVAVALALGTVAANAKATPGAAHKLALSGAQAARGCVAKPGLGGSWRQDIHGNWISCKAAANMGGGSNILLILAVVLIGAGIFVLADDDDNTPSSP